jgi:predicted transcriptional regulator
MKRDVKRDILKALSKHPEGLTITETADIVSINYMTTSKYMAILEAAGLIIFRQVGMAKLFTIKK